MSMGFFGTNVLLAGSWAWHYPLCSPGDLKTFLKVQALVDLTTQWRVMNPTAYKRGWPWARPLDMHWNPKLNTVCAIARMWGDFIHSPHWLLLLKCLPKWVQKGPVKWTWTPMWESRVNISIPTGANPLRWKVSMGWMASTLTVAVSKGDSLMATYHRCA